MKYTFLISIISLFLISELQAQRPLATVSDLDVRITYQDSLIEIDHVITIDSTSNIDSLIEATWTTLMSERLERYSPYESYKRAARKKVKIKRVRPAFDLTEQEVYVKVQKALDEGKTLAQIRRLDKVTEANLLKIVIKHIKNQSNEE